LPTTKMMYVSLRYFSKIFTYSFDLAKGAVRAIEERQIEDVCEQHKDVCLDTLSVKGFDPIYDTFLHMPDPINSHTIKLYCSIPMKVIVGMLGSQQVIGNSLIRFKLDGKVYVTDGVSYNEWSIAHDSRIKMSDRDSKYLMDNSVIVNQKFLPLLICFLHPPIDLTDSVMSFSSDPQISERFESHPCYEVIQSLCLYFAYFFQKPIMSIKHRFLPIILLCVLLSQGKFPLSELGEMLQFITYNQINVISTIGLIATLGWKPQGSVLGEPSYYIKV